MSGRKHKRKNSFGMTFLELLMGVVVVIILIALVGFQVTGLLQKAKVSAAKTTMTGIALCLGMIKDDTGLYPEKLEDINEPGPPDTIGTVDFSARDWYGPYGGTLSLTDPWGNDYEYTLQNIVFGPDSFEREGGGQFEETFYFDADAAGPGTLIIENPGVSSGSIELNDEEIVSQDEFKKITPSTVKEVTLLVGENKLYIKIGGTPGITITISISASATSKDATFALWTYGKDGDEGGSKYDADIVYGTY